MSTAVTFAVSRDELIGQPTFVKASDSLGVKRYRHDYPTDLIATIAAKAAALVSHLAERRHLGLTFIRGAHLEIPEITQLIHWPGRIERLSELAGTALEPYPVDVIASIVTVQSQSNDVGAITWHADGIPITEMIPLEISDLVGGELELFRGPAEVGLHRAHNSQGFDDDETLTIEHRPDEAILGQLMRVAHRVTPISQGHRITLNLNFRSRERPWVDDNSLCYLAADNPDFGFLESYLTDVRERQLPAYQQAAP